MRVLVTGGAGYIGAHVVRLLEARGDDVVVVDDLSSGDASRVPGPVVRLDLADGASRGALEDVLRDHRSEVVVHLAARKSVAESVRRPLWYYQQNVDGLVHLLAAMQRAGTPAIVFSSSAAVYGEVADDMVAETAPTNPVNPYGRSKLVGEWLVRDAAAAWGLRHVSLRYFNVAGAGWDDLGDPGTENLVTIALDRWRRGQPVTVHGSDYPTRDGSCVRDFVHVGDLAHAHLAAVDALAAGGQLPPALNIGTGAGTTVLEMLAALAAASDGRAGRLDRGPRRAGDPAQVVAAAQAVGDALGWSPRHTLADLAASAWRAADRRAAAPRP